MRTANGSTNGPEKYRRVLLSKRAELLAGLCGTVAAEGLLEDRVQPSRDHFIALQVNQLDCLQLRLIEAALVRMDSEEYGVCPNCGNAICRRRLEAIPWAVRCIACQELFSAASGADSFRRSIEPGDRNSLTERPKS